MAAQLDPIIGDIFLIRSHSQNKTPNTVAQTLLRFRKASFSHVAIQIGEFNTIHAMPKGGVHVVKTAELLKHISPENAIVLRHRDMQKNVTLQIKLREKLFFYYKQPYNFAFFLRMREVASYCSELAAKAYKDIGVPISMKNPRHVLPVDLEALRQHPDWQDVSLAYDGLNKNKQSTPLDEALDRYFASDHKSREDTEDLLIKLEGIFQENGGDQIKMTRMINIRRRMLGLKPISITLARYYWNLQKRKPSRD